MDWQKRGIKDKGNCFLHIPAILGTICLIMNPIDTFDHSEEH